MKTLISVDEILPKKVSWIMLGVHPSQDPAGMFSIVIHLEGPNLYALHKVIDAHRYLFDVKFVGTKLVPKVPMFDPFDTDFEFNDVIVDTSLQWLEELWEVFDGELKTLPTKVFGEEGYGSKTSKQLSV